MVKEIKNKEMVGYLNYLNRTYWSLTDMIAATKNRLQSLPGDHPVKYDRIIKGEEKEEGLETIKGRISRLLEKELKTWDIWTQWLQNVPGIGGPLAAELLILYYYKYLPICKDCGTELEKRNGTYFCQKCEKSVKGEGNLNYILKMKDFPTISKWWAYMGRDIENGGMRKRKKGEQLNWSTNGRKLGYLIGESFNKQQPNHLYKAVYLNEKAKYEKSQPDISKLWRHNKAKNNMLKLFLAHFWTVARIFDGKEVSKPYAMTIMGHTNYIEPFYFEPL